MSKLDDLIREFCPKGVEYVQLGAMEDTGLIKLGRGNVISKKDIAAEPGDYPIYSSSASGVGEFGRYGKYMFDDERLSWSVDGGGRFFYRRPHKYSVTNVSGWLKVLDSSRIDIKYLFYALDSAWSTKKFDYTKKAHPSVIRNEYKIPLLPLEVQKEIASILDKFTQLEAELSAELSARRKQYEFYRDYLLKLDVSGTVDYRMVGDICKLVRGKRLVKSELETEGEFAVYQNSMTPLGYYDKSNFSGDTTFIIGAGAAGEIGYSSTDFWAADDVYVLQPLGSVKSRFLYHALENQKRLLSTKVRRASIPRLSRISIEKLSVPVPSLDQQDRIVTILDQFDTLVNDIYSGIPAEVKARRQQYEYYRTKLLTFQELSA